jgi:hypothetical protein
MSPTLPSGLRRAELRGFCVAASGIMLFALFLVCGPSMSFVYAGAAIAPLSASGMIYPSLLIIPYRIWNKCAKLYARFAQISLMAIAYHFIVRIVGLMALSGQFKPARSGISAWVPRRTITVLAYDSQYEAPDHLSIHAPWTAGFVSWARRTPNVWAVCLLPFMILVSILEPEEEREQVSDIYTLF